MIRTRNGILHLINADKKIGKTIGFTSGCFDIIHAGHISFLEEAANKCDTLIVGINSDSSVKKYKGNDRPIVNEKDRLEVVNSIRGVVGVFLFDERRNKINIEILKPDYYFKAGDYKKDELTSAKYVEAYGGEAIIIPVSNTITTTKIINKIRGENIIKEDAKIAFLDRDGTIIKSIAHLSDPKKVELLDGVVEDLIEMQKTHKLIIVTNQAGIGLGYFTKEQFYDVNSRMLSLLNKHGIIIDKIFYCPHIPGSCECRKPKDGLLRKAEKYYNVDKKNSYIIGDSKCDIDAGKAYGITAKYSRWGR